MKASLLPSSGLRIYLNGLSLFVKDNVSVEFAYLEPEHPPVQLILHNRYGHPVWAYPFAAVRSQPIRFSIEKAPTTHSVTFHRNFEHMPDLAQWHQGSTVKLLEGMERAMSAKIVIKDAEFFTARTCIGEAVRTDDRPNPGTSSLHNVGRIMGADIECGPSEQIVFNLVGERGPLTGPKPLTQADGFHMLSIAYESEVGCVHKQPLHLIYDNFLEDLGVRFRLDYVQPEPGWKMNGWVADDLVPLVFFDANSWLGRLIPAERRILYSTKQDAMNEGRIEYPMYLDPVSDQYACQGYGGGGGPLPDFP